MKSRLVLIIAIAGLLTGCDQAAKMFAVNQLRDLPPQSYVGDIVRIQYSENQGAFLSLGAGLPADVRVWVFTVFTGILLLGMLGALIVTLRGKQLNPLALAGFVLFLGGGLGNLVDRLLNGGIVVDFLNLGLGPVRTGIFNLADVFLMGGVAVLFVASLGLSDRAKRT